MPELPEVETIVRDLDRVLRGRVIIDFEVLNEKTRRARPFLNISETKFRKAVLGKEISSIWRRAKMLVFDLGDPYVLAHLKMTGQLVYEHRNEQPVVGGHPIVNAGSGLPNKFTRAIFSFDDGSRLFFNDVRRFGWLRFLDKAGLGREFSTIGLEPLGRGFTVAALSKIWAKKAKSSIKQAIMDQEYLVGVGNIYADEALFASKIKPSRRAGAVSQDETKRLHDSIVRILSLSIKNRGTSFSDYRDGHGRAGGFVKLLKVYGRAKLPCKICGTPISKGKIGGRGTHWCDQCQR